MNFIEFTKEHLSYNEESREHYIEIPKAEIGPNIESVQIINEDGYFTSADCDITENHSTFIISLPYPSNLRVNF